MNRRAFLHTTLLHNIQTPRIRPVGVEQKDSFVYSSQNKKLFVETLYVDCGKCVTVYNDITWQDFNDTPMNKKTVDTYILEGDWM